MKWLRILKLRLIRGFGFKLTSDENSELAFWITRNIKEPSSVTLAKLNGEVDEFGGRFICAPYIPIFRKPKIFTKNGLQEMEKMGFEKLFESLWKASDREFVDTVRYGLVAVDVSGAARHFCGYGHEPTWADREHLLQELRTNESFGLVGVHFTLDEAPPDLILHYLREQDDYNWEIHDGKFRRR